MSDKTVVRHILRGEYVFSNGFYELGDEILESPVVLRQIFESHTDSEKVKIIENVFPTDKFEELLDAISDVLRKKDSLAELLKKTGDKFLKKSNMTSALKCYNLATLFIPAKNPLIGSFFVQRATVLLQSGKIEECLSDIETASTFTLTQELEASLLEMKLKCLKLKPDSDGLEENRIQEIRHNGRNDMFDISGNANPKIKSGTEFIKVVTNKDKGRTVVLTKDLGPGVAVIVEHPYMIALSDGCQWDTNHCSYCLKEIIAGVRCRKCVFNNYCSDKCRRADFYDGHQYECKCLPLVHIMRVPPGIHMCLKIICKVGPGALYKLYNSSNDGSVNKENDDIKGFDPVTGIYNSNSYHQIRNLISHDYVDTKPVITIPWMSLALARALKYETNFFKDIKSVDKSGFLYFVANELVFLCHSIPFNAFGRYGVPEIPADGSALKATRVEPREFGCGIYSLISLINHKCDPNVFRYYLPNGKMAIITNRKLKAGDEVLLNYGYTYYMDELSYRQSKLKADYRFVCKCSACRFNWPKEVNMIQSLEFICSNCCEKFDYENTEEAKKYVVIESENGGECKSCGKKYEMDTLRMEEMIITEKVTKAQNLVKTGKMVEAFPILIECIEYYQTKMLYPNTSFLAVQDIQHACQLLYNGAPAL